MKIRIKSEVLKKALHIHSRLHHHFNNTHLNLFSKFFVFEFLNASFHYLFTSCGIYFLCGLGVLEVALCCISMFVEELEA